MADTDRIKRNLGKMIDQGAPETDLNAYLATEGFKSPDEWRAAVAKPTAQADDPGGSGVPAMPDMAGHQRGRPERTSDWIGSRIVNTVTNALGTPRALADLTDAAGQKLGVGNALSYMNPVTAGQKVLQQIHPALSPSTEDMRGFVRNKVGMPTVNTPSAAGPIIDAGVETALGGVSGGPRAIAPMLVGGAASEAGGEATAGTPYEPVARIGGALLGGGGTAAIQNVGGSVIKGTANALGSNARNVDKQAVRVIARGLANDKLTADELANAHAAMPQGTPLFVAGGENTRGALRGSTAGPGEARTVVADAEQNFKNEIERLKVERSTASTPKYEAAGVPKKPEPTLEYTAGPDGEVMAKVNGFNTPIVQSEKINSLIANSADIKQAIRAARRLPAFKDLPDNSMSMLDKAYKHLGGLEKTAVRQGNGTRAGDIGAVRRELRDAITEVNPAYGEALDEYASMSQALNQHEKTTAKAFRGVTSGSRTTPMMLEAEDNAATNALANVARGRFGRAALDAGNILVGRVGEGRTKAVNAKIAEMLTETDPQKVGLVNALIEKSRLDEIARRTGRRNALTYGTVAPAAYGATQ